MRCGPGSGDQRSAGFRARHRSARVRRGCCGRASELELQLLLVAHSAPVRRQRGEQPVGLRRACAAGGSVDAVAVSVSLPGRGSVLLQGFWPGVVDGLAGHAAVHELVGRELVEPGRVPAGLVDAGADTGVGQSSLDPFLLDDGQGVERVSPGGAARTLVGGVEATPPGAGPRVIGLNRAGASQGPSCRGARRGAVGLALGADGLLEFAVGPGAGRRVVKVLADRVRSCPDPRGVAGGQPLVGQLVESRRN